VGLKAAPEEHMPRVSAQGDMRPFKGRSAALGEIKKLLADRDQLYARASATIDTSGKSVKHSLEQLKRAIA
jgi:XRE family aerobic/anaerobic benzoate catabolism transcriptional regulator